MAISTVSYINPGDGQNHPIDAITVNGLTLTSIEKDYWNGKQDALTFDSIPTENSNNPVKSGGIYSMITDNEYVVATALNDLNDRVIELEAFSESDPTVPSWAKAETKPSYTASEVGALPADTVIPTVDGYFDEVEYDANTKRINFKNGTTVKKYIDATAFIKDGMVDTVSISTPSSGANAGVDCLIVTFNTESGKDNIEIPVSRIFNASNYYTKTESNSIFIFASSMDSVPTANSNNPVKSSGLYSAISSINSRLSTLESATESDPVFSASAAAAITTANISSWNSKISGVNFNGSAASVSNGVAFISLSFDSIPTENSNNLVKSGDLYTVITENEYVEAAAINDLNDRLYALEVSSSNYLTEESDPVFYSSAAADITYSHITKLNSLGNAKIFYGTCSTAAATTAKVVTCSDFTSGDLVKGALIFVTFDATNSGAIADITLNVNNTGAKHITKLYNTTLNPNLTSAGELKANKTYLFGYDGTYWVCLTLDYNTSYTAMTSAEATTGTSTSSRIISAARLKEGIQAHDAIRTIKVNGTALTITSQAVDITVPTASTVSGWGFLTSESDPVFSSSVAASISAADITNWNSKTSNTGTITGISMNGSSKGTSGNVNLGTVITAISFNGTAASVSNGVASISLPAVLTSSQVLTSEQKMQARKNQGLYYDESKSGATITWNGDVSSGYNSSNNFNFGGIDMYKVASGPVDIPLSALGPIQAYRYGSLVTRNLNWSYQATGDGADFDSGEIIRGYDNDFWVWIVKDAAIYTGEEGGWPIDDGIYFYYASDDTYVSSLTIYDYSEIHKVEDKYLPVNDVKIGSTSIVNSNGEAVIPIPEITSSDNGKILIVSNGQWALTSPISIYNGTSTPNNSQGVNGDLYLQTS